jgi:hypothetical protein
MRGSQFRFTLYGSRSIVLPREKLTLREKVKRFMEYRRRKREEDLSVDTFFNHGSTRTRFANFDD